jgi:hypothetical protein
MAIMRKFGRFGDITLALAISCCLPRVAIAQTSSAPFPDVAAAPVLPPAMVPAAPAGADVTLAEPLAAVKPVLLKVNESLEKTHPQKWKVKGDEHEVDERNYLSIHEDIVDVLPGMLKTAQANPHSLSSGIAVYRNINALYDVLVRVEQTSELVGKEDSPELQDAVARVETLRGQLVERLIALSVQQETRIADAQRVLNAQAAVPKHIVADDAPPPKKKPAKKAAGTKASGSKAASTAAAGSASTPKPATGTQ